MKRFFLFLYPVVMLVLLFILKEHRGGINSIVFLPMIAMFLFRLKPIPLLKFTYLTPTPALVILTFILAGPFWGSIIVFSAVLMSDIVRTKNLETALINASSFSIVGLIVSLIFEGKLIFSPGYFILYTSIYFVIIMFLFYTPEFVQRSFTFNESLYLFGYETLYIFVSSLITYGFLYSFHQGMLPFVLYLVFLIPVIPATAYILSMSIEAKRMRILYRMQDEMEALSVKDAINLVVQNSKKFIDWTNVNFAVVEDEKMIRLIYSTGKGFVEDFVTDMGKGVSARAIKAENTIIVDDVRKDPDVIVVNPDFRSEMCVPIFYQGRPIGLLDFEHSLPKAFSKYDVKMGEFFAKQLSRSFKLYLDLSPIVDSVDRLNFRSKEIKGAMNISMEVVEKNIDESRGVSKDVKDILEGLKNAEEEFSGISETFSEIESGFEELGIRIKGLASNAYEKADTLNRQREILAQIQSFFNEIRETISILTERSKFFNDVIGSIKELSDDTGLLALNASIEAQRAGEKGSGFGVIAEEINKLSQNVKELSINAGKEIERFLSLLDELVKSLENREDDLSKTSEFSESLSEFIQFLSNEIQNLLKIMSVSMEKMKNGMKEMELLRENVEVSLNKALKSGENVDRIIGTIINIFESMKEFESFASEIRDEILGFYRIVEKFSLDILRRKNAEEEV